MDVKSLLNLKAISERNSAVAVWYVYTFNFNGCDFVQLEMTIKVRPNLGRGTQTIQHLTTSKMSSEVQATPF